MNKKIKTVFSYLMIIVGAILASFSVACILLPNDAIDYGTAGIAIIISKLTGYNLSLCVLLVFLPFLIAGVILIGKYFFAKTFVGFVVYTIGLSYFEKIPFELNTEHFIAYRIVIAMPRCHLKNGENVREEELRYLYEIANILPGFLEERGFTAEPARGVQESTSPLLSREAKPYYRDYICNNSEDDYQSLHITFYDNSSRSYMEVQLRTKEMDDVAEIGSANHLSYEKKQESERRRRDAIPQGECIYFDEAYERGMRLLGLDLAALDVNMFGAVNNSLINDGCGLFRGRMILPYEHLSRFQNDIVD